MFRILLFFSPKMKTLLVIASIYGFSGVILGAFGAHALKEKLDAAHLQTFETGVRYQLIHAAVLLVLALLAGRPDSGLIKWSGFVMAVGVLLFSGSIYLLATRDVTGLSHARWLGPITPLGGLCLISGWLLLLIWALRLRA